MTVSPGNRAAPDGADARLEAIAQRFSGPLRSFFRKRMRDPQDVEDLVQEVFVRIAGRSGAAQMDCPEAYVFQTAANLLRDRARRHATHARGNQMLADRAEDFVEEISPERVLLGKRRLAEFRKALAELPERTRAIFLLHRFEEFKYAEIAARLGISTSSVEKHMMEAIRHIVHRMGRD